MADSPRNPKAGVMDTLVPTEVFGEYRVPTEPVEEPEAVVPPHEHTPSEAGRMLQRAPHHDHPEAEPVLVKPKGELTASARTGAQRPATPRSQKQKDGK